MPVITKSEAQDRCEDLRDETVADAITPTILGALLLDIVDSVLFSGAGFSSPADPADDGKICYADGGGNLWAANIKTDGTRLTFGAGATAGLIGVANNVDVLYGKTNAGANVKLIGSVDTGDIWRLGASALNKIYFDLVAGANGEIGIWFSSTQRYGLKDSKFEFSQAASASGTADNAFRVNAGAHASFTANTEVRDITLNLNRTVSLLAGTIAAQRSIRINRPTFTANGATVITKAATLSIDGPPAASGAGGATPTFGNALALEIESGALGFGDCAVDGTIRLPNNGFVAYKHATLGTLRAFTVGSDTYFGDFEASLAGGVSLYYDAGLNKGHIYRVNQTEVAVFTKSGSVGQFDWKNGRHIGVAAINGATVVAPVEGAEVTTTATVTASQGGLRRISSAGGSYSLTVGTGGSPLNGMGITFYALTALANQITLVNGGAGGGNIYVIPPGFKGSLSTFYDGVNWQLSYGSVYVVA